jgi:ATP adenylyltransferase
MDWPNLAAPWRLDYIKSVAQKPAGCFICDAWATPEQDQAKFVIARNEVGMIMMNRYPYTNGSVMIVPGRHVGDLVDLASSERSQLMEMVVTAQRMIAAVLNPQGMNIGMNIGRIAGAGVPGHLHIHVVPRWGGDTNFMHVIGGVQVNPQAIDDVYGAFRAAMPMIAVEDQP